MNFFRTILFLTIFLIISEKANSCDSIRVVLSIDYFPGEDPVYSHYSESWSWDSTGTVISWFKQDRKEVIAYNQFGQIIFTETYNLINGNYIPYERIENYYSISHKDSLQLTYKWSPQLLTKQKNWTYDLNDNLVFYIEESLQGVTFDTTQMILTHYPVGLPDVIRIDSVFSGTPDLYYETLHAYTTVGSSIYYRIFEAGAFTPPDYSWSDQFFSGRYQCGVLSGTTYLSPITQVTHHYIFDNECRLLEYDHPSSTGRTNSHYEYYYYGDCNHMIMLMNSDQNKICRGDSVNLSANVFAGTPPYHYSWMPNTFLIDDSDLSTTAFPPDTTNFILTVTDSLGLTITDTLQINVNHINLPNLFVSNIDSTNGCYFADLSFTATTGSSFVINKDSVNSPYSYWGPLPVHVVYNGPYILNIYSDECPMVSDSVVLNLAHPSPYLTLTEGCNVLIASSPSANIFNWYANWPLTLVFQGSILPIDSIEHYVCKSVDSLGCVSEQKEMWGRPYFIETYFYLKCNDSCNSIGNVLIYPDWPPSEILWSNGDTSEWTTTLCDGVVTVTVTNEHGCVLMETNDTCTVSVEEINVNKLQIFPVPAHSEIKITIEADEFPYDIFLTDMFGRIKSLGRIHSKQSELSLQEIISGTYIFNVVKENHVVIRKKLIVY